MSFMKTPTSSLTGIELITNKLWYRSKAKFKRCFSGGVSATSTPHPCSSPITRLPHELVEVIISYFIHDTCTLLACSVTCYSWYIAAVPHLHYSLTTDNFMIVPGDEKYRWPKPLQKSYNLGLLPLVKRFSIRLQFYRPPEFTPKWLSGCTLRYFSALTNLQELGIDKMQVSRFMPNIQRCFGHLAPTLRFLALREPRGSCRQILYFIGLFPNLQDLKLCYPSPTEEREGTIDVDLVPLSVPPLRGRLTLICFTRKKLVKDMIALFGGLRFHYMHLFRVKCVRLLLDACTETLEPLQLYPADPYENSQAVRRDFDLSRNKTLRTLKTTAASITYPGDAASDFLKTVLSTITSPLPLDVVVNYLDEDVDFTVWTRVRPAGVESVNLDRAAENAIEHQDRFKVFSEMYKVRVFRLVLCAGVLERIVETEGRKGGLDYLACEPLIISEIRSPCRRLMHGCVGYAGGRFTYSSAL